MTHISLMYYATYCFDWNVLENKLHKSLSSTKCSNVSKKLSDFNCFIVNRWLYIPTNFLNSYNYSVTNIFNVFTYYTSLETIFSVGNACS